MIVSRKKLSARWLSERRYFVLRELASQFKSVAIRSMYPYGKYIKTPLNVYRNREKPERFLEIGPGKTPLKGFETINISWAKHIDYLADASRTLPFENDTYDLIYASHVLEHVSWYLLRPALNEWVRVLKPGGKIELWVPNGLKIARAFVLAEDGERDDIHLDGWYKYNEEKDPCIWANGRIFSYGDGRGTSGDPNWHLAMFSPRYLQKVMHQIGLVNIESLSPEQVRGNDHGWINMGFSGVKP